MTYINKPIVYAFYFLRSPYKNWFCYFKTIADKLKKPEIKVFAAFFPSYHYPAGNNIFKVNNRNTKMRCEIRSKLTIKIPKLLTFNIFHNLF